MANGHRMRNCLKKIRINGSWFEDETAIKRGIVESFQGLLFGPGGWRSSLLGLSFKQIRGGGREMVTRLEDSFIEEEVFAAVSDLNRDKAPGPNGFPLAFWQFSWDFFKEEVLGFFNEFYEQSRFVKSLNSFLVLIPKQGDAVDIKDFKAY